MIRDTLRKCLLAFFTLFMLHISLYASNRTIYTCNNSFSFDEVYDDHCDSETAFAFLNVDDDPLMADEISQCFIPDFNRWGWTTYLDFSDEAGQASYEFDIYSGAGQCDLSKGTDVGWVNVSFSDESLTFEYNLEGFVLSEAHIYVGSNPYPTKPNGQETVAPGQYTYVDSQVGDQSSYSVTLPVDGDAFYIIIHGVTKGADCDECPDQDADGVCDEDDICPGSDDNLDSDGDGIPDGCDNDSCPDSDADGVCDEDDICPGFDDNLDSDGDSIPDGCDDNNCPDADGDGVCDDDDICPGFDDTIDSDGDGIPDGCDNGAFSIEEDVSTFPIPFNDVINVKYSFEFDTYVIIELYDMKGTKLKSMKIDNYLKGTNAVSKINLGSTSNQLLFLRLSTSKGEITKKVISFK